RDTNRQLIFELLGDPIPDDSLVLYRQELANSGLPNLQLSVIQDKDLGLDQINRMQLEISNLEQLADNLQTVQKVKSEQERRIEELQHRIDSLRADTIAFEQIVREARVLFSGLESTAYARARKTNYKTSTHQLPLFLVEWSPSKSRTERRRDEEKLHEFLKLRTGLDTLQIVSY
ncbi:MAG: hypothetical protein R3350_03680, partial [Saprospiraceae bacterium]|nr:hypothetical protein [Saprospiraceae bacterium]